MTDTEMTMYTRQSGPWGLAKGRILSRSAASDVLQISKGGGDGSACDVDTAQKYLSMKPRNA